MGVSLYVPCYNGAPWLADCLDALLGQTRPADEVLVVDDGSTDGSAAIAAGFAPRVRVLAHPRNLGLAVARNTALAAATGEIVASVDADVRVTPRWLARLLAAFTSPRVVAAGGRLEEANRERLADRWRAAHMAQHAGGAPLVNPPVLPGANVAVRRDVVRAAGGYDETFRTNYEDADLQHRLQAAGYLCRYEPGALAYHLRRDSAASVLRTYWGWLRPPFERQGAFRTGAGLVAKAEAGAGFAVRALWADLAGGDPRLAYLCLLVLLAFPAADLAHAGRLAAAGEADAPEQGAALQAAAGAWPRLVPEALRDRSPTLAARVGGDVSRIAWWRDNVADGGRPGMGRAPEADAVLAVVRSAVERLPRAWWPEIEAARFALAAEEGWPLGPPSLSPALAPAGALGDRLSGAARWLGEAGGAEALAVVLHGAAGRGESAPWAPVELLLVVREALPEARRERLRAGLATRLLHPDVRLDVVVAHRLGWMGPDLLQQSLLAGAVLLWGDGAVIRAIPSWPPERLDPRLALDEAAGAVRLLAAGRARLAVARAAGALLLARGAYTPRLDARAGALAAVWPEAPAPRETTAAAFVETAGRLVRDWLLTWEGDGPDAGAAARYGALRGASLERGGYRPA